MGADEPLEDDPWGVQPPDVSTRAKAFLYGEVIVLGIGAGIGLWLATDNIAWLIIGAVSGPATAMLLRSAFRGDRFWRWLDRPGRGAYRGPWWLGAETEKRIHERRMRILREREERAKGSDSHDAPT
jgi:hypothetical protein